jgi:hypothetical protein
MRSVRVRPRLLNVCSGETCGFLAKAKLNWIRPIRPSGPVCIMLFWDMSLPACVKQFVGGLEVRVRASEVPLFLSDGMAFHLAAGGCFPIGRAFGLR